MSIKSICNIIFIGIVIIWVLLGPFIPITLGWHIGVSIISVTIWILIIDPILSYFIKDYFKEV